MVFLLLNWKVQKRNSVGGHTECLAAGALKVWLLFPPSPLASCENFGRHLGLPAINMILRVICYMPSIEVWLRHGWQFYYIFFMATERLERNIPRFSLTGRIWFHPNSRFSPKWNKNYRTEIEKQSEWWENTWKPSKESLWLYSLMDSSKA
jgi:hypothetical protein